MQFAVELVCCFVLEYICGSWQSCVVILVVLDFVRSVCLQQEYLLYRIKPLNISGSNILNFDSIGLE
jgi:hypothetical protein